MTHFRSDSVNSRLRSYVALERPSFSFVSCSVIGYLLNPRRAGAPKLPWSARGGGRRLDVPSHLTRLLGVVARNGKKSSKARQKTFRNYFSQFFAKVSIEVIRGHQMSNDTNDFSLITLELIKLEK